MTTQKRSGGKGLVLAVIGLLVAALAVYAGYRLFSPPPATVDMTYNTVSSDGLYQVMFETDTLPIPLNETHSWVLTVTTPKGEPVNDAEIGIDGGMPAHGHGLPTEPKVTEALGEGRYQVEGMRFNMGGHWEIRVGINAAQGTDEATFNLDL